MSSSSDESDDCDEQKRLAQALDPDFVDVGKHRLLERMTTSGSGVAVTTNGKSDKLKSENGTKTELPPSKRPKSFQAESYQVEYDKPYSLHVTPECQKFIAKQLAKALEKNLEERIINRKKVVSGNETSPKKAVEVVKDTGIKLFASSEVIVTEKDLQAGSVVTTKRSRPTWGGRYKNKKKKSKKSKKDASSDSSSSESEDERLKSVAVSADWVLSGR